MLRDPTSGERFQVPKTDIEELRPDGTLMPDGLAAAMSTDRAPRPGPLPARSRHDRRTGGRGTGRGIPTLRPSSRSTGLPLDPEQWPSWQLPVNRERIYDFYAKEAEYFSKQPSVPPLLPPFPGLDGGGHGHWGNQNEDTWADGRWNQTDLGTVLCGIFRGAGVTVPKGVCVRLGDRGELAACFNPETLCYEALWSGGFVKFSAVRHGLMDGLIMDGTPLPQAGGQETRQAVRLSRILPARQAESSSRTASATPRCSTHPGSRTAGSCGSSLRRREHPLAACDARRARPVAAGHHDRRERWAAAGTWPYVVDTIEPPFHNPWNALLFFGGHDFFPDGTAMLCTIQGDVWRVEGLDETLEARALAAVCLGLAPGPGTGHRRRESLRARPRPDHSAARP